MRTNRERIALARPDRGGLLAAAAVRRRFDGDIDLQFVGEHEVARRLYGLATEPGLSEVWVVGLEPSDSVGSLVRPAVDEFAKRGRTVTWIARGLPEWLESGGSVKVIEWDDTPLWAAARGADDPGFSDFVSASLGEASAWEPVLAATCSTWEWGRVYEIAQRLARLEAPGRENESWAEKQLQVVRDAEEALRSAPVALVDARSVVVLSDAGVAAGVRPEALARVREDVDALALVTSPNRIIVLGRDLSFLQDLVGGQVTVGSLHGERADLVFDPRDPPARIREIFGSAAFHDRPDAGAVARIHRPADRRITKNFGVGGLVPGDRDAISAARRDTDLRT